MVGHLISPALQQLREVQLENRKKLASWIATENEKDLKLAFPRLALGRAKNAPAG